VGAFRRRVRVEHARMLLASSALTVDAVAEQAGFADARQLRRLWRKAYGGTPGRARARAQRPA
jgi:transcriptional regulator GlxA family with amidase domain